MARDNKADSKLKMEDLTFEEAFSKLEDSVKALEEGDLILSEAVSLFEDSMALALLCSERLAAAELKISRIETTHGEQMKLLEEEEVPS